MQQHTDQTIRARMPAGSRDITLVTPYPLLWYVKGILIN